MGYLYLLLIGMEISLALAIILEVIFIHFYEVATVKEDLIFVLLINVVTNPIVVAISSSLTSLTNLNKWIIQIPLEIIVVFVEWLFYKKYINYIKRPFRCALFANGISYFLPIVITFILGVSFGLTTVFANPISTPADTFYYDKIYESNEITGGYASASPGGASLGKQNIKFEDRATDIAGIPKYILFDKDQGTPNIPEIPWNYSVCVIGVALIEMSIGIHLIKVKLNKKS